MFAHGGVGGDQHDAAQQQEEEAQHRGPALGGILLGSWHMMSCHTHTFPDDDSYPWRSSRRSIGPLSWLFLPLPDPIQKGSLQ